jgi:hypothetical protein
VRNQTVRIRSARRGGRSPTSIPRIARPPASFAQVRGYIRPVTAGASPSAGGLAGPLAHGRLLAGGGSRGGGGGKGGSPGAGAGRASGSCRSGSRTAGRAGARGGPSGSRGTRGAGNGGRAGAGAGRVSVQGRVGCAGVRAGGARGGPSGSCRAGWVVQGGVTGGAGCGAAGCGATGGYGLGEALGSRGARGWSSRSTRMEMWGTKLPGRGLWIPGATSRLPRLPSLPGLPPSAGVAVACRGWGGNGPHSRQWHAEGRSGEPPHSRQRACRGP